MDRGSQIVFDQILLFAGPETAEHENGLADAAFAEFDAFTAGGHAKPVGAKLLQSLGRFAGRRARSHCL